ncbi:FAD-binding oxidoreductase [Achromobacter denitrificans]|uniref:FAD-binding oxidoreductase n=3 Tax=Achromobacter denitrificans TaxID=32002 RepID=A0A6J5AM09_ACHDE|nr:MULTISPECIES: FAD-binding oxidoreductase [Achromobacter]MBV2161608.1 FAD-binding oxidoreductase [Achromobacter denitrificans]MDX3878303.1 FAD-binding oxidoreductase [Achromobacter sp.]MPT40060.1 FAD-binding oxidoreductase [Achromobacter sp.]OLU08063.1 D-amino-acid oxidase [Achromobacter denitrificans]QCS64031.1 FAD-binding oxidoreductase [Achromobacter denitrificans]
MTTQTQFPATVDVAIIGGGIIGASTALALARAGVSTALFEKGTLACEQSSRNWGWVRTLGRDQPEVPLALRANRLWSEIQAQVDVGYRRNGLVYLQETEADAAGHETWLREARAHGVQAEMLGREAALRLLPRSERPWTGALYSAADGVAEPQIATQGVAALARQAGALIFEGCAVRGVEKTAGRVDTVITERGTLRAQAVVVAAGGWSRLFCGNLGVDFPQLKVRGSVLRTDPFDAGVALAINGKDFTCRKRADGGYTVSQFSASLAELVPDSFRLMGKFLRTWIENNALVRVRFSKRFFEELATPRRFPADRETPYERCRVLDPAPYARGVDQAWERLLHAFPVFRQARIAQSWGGYIDVTPDAMPVIAPVTQAPGLYLASGFSGHGFGIGPAVGETLAALIQGRDTPVDIRPFRLERYA